MAQAEDGHADTACALQLLTDLSSGVLQIAWADPSAPLPLLQSGVIRGIAISGDVRVPQAKNVPTMGEQGYPFEAKGWFGMFAPAGTPAPIVQRLTAEVNKVQDSPEMARRMESLNFEPPPVKTQAQFRDIVSTDLKVWKQIAAEANVSVDN
jgi:tripartite-type tricarboxylate transporter receptor subunit TctC